MYVRLGTIPVDCVVTLGEIPVLCQEKENGNTCTCTSFSLGNGNTPKGCIKDSGNTSVVIQKLEIRML